MKVWGRSLAAVAAIVALAAGAASCSNSGNETPPAGRDAGPLVTLDSGLIDAAPPSSAPVPVLTSLAPSSVAAGAPDTVVSLTGTGFVDRSTVEINGAVVASTLVDADHLNVVFSAATLIIGAQLHVNVTTSTPGGGASASLSFQVLNPAPTLRSISPLSAQAGGGDLELTVSGGQFAQAAAIDFDGLPMTTSYVSTAALTATIPSGLLLAPNTHVVNVVNPDPGGGTSSNVIFTVYRGGAVVTSVSPASAIVGSPDVTLTVTGTGIETGSSVTFNGDTLVTTAVDATHLSAVLPAKELTTAGMFPVSVLGPSAGETPGVPVVFTVDYGAPTITSATPAELPLGASNTTLTLHGDGFLPTATITLDGQSAAATYVDTATMSVVVPTSLLATAHSLQVVITTPSPGGASSPFSVPVGAVAPDLVSLSPSSVFVGAAATPVTFAGTGFLATSIARIDGSALATTFGNAGSLTATVPAALLTTVGTHQLTVDNGGSGGVSAPLTFVVGCDPTGVDIILAAVGTSETVSVNWSAQPMLTPITTTGSGVCPSQAGTGTQPYIGWVVQNATAATHSLEAWAVCSSEEDAFLTFYQRSTVPTTIGDALACTGSIAEGLSGYDGLSSPESNGADYCPGLTVADSSSLSLPVCGTAVVFLQPWKVNSSAFPPPTTVRVDLQ
jgi:hypothetical protein